MALMHTSETSNITSLSSLASGSSLACGRGGARQSLSFVLPSANCDKLEACCQCGVGPTLSAVKVIFSIGTLHSCNTLAVSGRGSFFLTLGLLVHQTLEPFSIASCKSTGLDEVSLTLMLKGGKSYGDVHSLEIPLRRCGIKRIETAKLRVPSSSYGNEMVRASEMSMPIDVHVL
ncbi:hypothetical protein Tco_0837821 [Tanacetum coccineum]